MVRAACVTGMPSRAYSPDVGETRASSYSVMRRKDEQVERRGEGKSL